MSLIKEVAAVCVNGSQYEEIERRYAYDNELYEKQEQAWGVAMADDPLIDLGDGVPRTLHEVLNHNSLSYLHEMCCSDETIIEIASNSDEGKRIVDGLKKEGLITKKGRFTEGQVTLRDAAGNEERVQIGRNAFEDRFSPIMWVLEGEVRDYFKLVFEKNKPDGFEPTYNGGDAVGDDNHFRSNDGRGIFSNSLSQN